MEVGMKRTLGLAALLVSVSGCGVDATISSREEALRAISQETLPDESAGVQTLKEDAPLYMPAGETCTLYCWDNPQNIEAFRYMWRPKAKDGTGGNHCRTVCEIDD